MMTPCGDSLGTKRGHFVPSLFVQVNDCFSAKIGAIGDGTARTLKSLL